MAGRRPGGRAKRRFMHVVKRGHEVGWCERRRRRGSGKTEAADWLWPSLKGTAASRSDRDVSKHLVRNVAEHLMETNSASPLV